MDWLIYIGELLFEWFDSVFGSLTCLRDCNLYWSNLFGYNYFLSLIYGGNRLQGSGCHMSWCNISLIVELFHKDQAKFWMCCQPFVALTMLHSAWSLHVIFRVLILTENLSPLICVVNLFFRFFFSVCFSFSDVVRCEFQICIWELCFLRNIPFRRIWLEGM